MNIQRSRMIIKKDSNAGVVPTIPVSNDHTDGSWLNTDVYDGEMFLNTTDQKMWYRAGNVIKEVSVNSASTLNDLYDVVITAPALNETLIYTSANTWENGLISSFNTLIDVDYALLVSSITYALLIPGNFYRLTDYKTIHLIPDTTDINTCALEPLILLATGPQSISTRVYSAAYTQDHIEYNWSDNLAEDATTPRPGYIYYRKDMINNVEAFCDWRGYLLRRYALIQDSSYNWDSGSTYAVGDIVQYTSNNYLYFCHNTVTIAGSDPLTDQKHWINITDLSVNLYQFSLGQKIGNTALNLDATYFDWNIFNDVATNISLGQGSNDNVFFGSSNIINIDVNSIRNTFFDVVAIIDMGYACESNFINNSLVVKFGNSCKFNIISKGASNSEIGSASVSNIIGSSSTHNIIGRSCVRNYVGNGSTYNKFGDACNDNKLNVTCSNNILGYNCYSNIFSSTCISNKFGDNCYSNTFGSDCVSNIFGNNCYLNVFGNNSTVNIFKNYCYSNTFGSDCDSNIFLFIDNVNFTSATHVYNSYTCELFTRQDGTPKLRYVNNSDIQVIVNATA